MISGSEYLAECVRQGVDLDYEIAGRLVDGATNFKPGEQILYSVRDALDFIYPRAPRPLASGRLDQATMLGADTPAKSLTSIINGTLVPADESLPAVTSESFIFYENCYDAEARFYGTVARLGDVSSRGNVPGEGSQIFLTDEGEPILLRKGYGSKLGLTLGEISVNGYAVPPGTIASVSVSGKNASGGGYPRYGKVDVLSHRAIDVFRPHRLAEFALTPAERAERPWDDYSAGKQENFHRMKDIEMADIKAAAARAALKIRRPQRFFRASDK